MRRRWQKACALWEQSSADRLGLIAAGVAFYGLLALFPAIAATMALAGLWVDPAMVLDQIETVSRLLPAAAAEIVVDQAVGVAGAQSGDLGLTAIVGLAVAFWSVTRAVRNMIIGLNIVHQMPETRSFLHLNTLILALSICLIVGFLIAVALAAVLPVILALMPMTDELKGTLGALRWLLLIGFTLGSLMVFYRLGPAHQDRRRWLTPGVFLAALLWIGGSILFGWYVANFASYQQTFGALGGAVILLVWLWLSAYVVLLGAEVDRHIL